MDFEANSTQLLRSDNGHSRINRKSSDFMLFLLVLESSHINGLLFGQNQIDSQLTDSNQSNNLSLRAKQMSLLVGTI